MAKILIATNPLSGHTNPAYPIARKLVERGHEVVWYTGKAFKRQVEATGARYVPVLSGMDWSLIDIMQWIKENHPELVGKEGITLIKAGMKFGFIEPSLAHLNACLEILRNFKADLILSDSLFVAGEFLHRKTGIPYAVFGESVLGIKSKDTAPFGPALPPSASPLGRLRNRVLSWFIGKVVFREINEYYDATRKKIGLAPAGMTFFDTLVPDQLFLQGTVPSFEYPRSDLPPQVHFVGPFLPPRSNDFTPPNWWHLLETDKPVVLVTQGTVNNDANDLIIPTLKALENENVLVIATTGGAKAEELNMGQIPANARIEPFVPYSELLPHVDVMITNGGYGGVQMSLAKGVPIIIAGTTEDKAEVSARVAWSGVGINLKTKTPSQAQIKKAYQDILADPTYREKARLVQAEIARHDPTTEAAILLEQLIATHQPVVSMPSKVEVLTSK